MQPSLDQWRAFIALAETGTYAGAARRLHRTPSSIYQAVRGLQDNLGVEALTVAGRRSQLTAAGEALRIRGRQLLDSAERISLYADALAAGRESEIGLALEVLFPEACLTAVLDRFAAICQSTRLQIYESVLSATTEHLLQGRAQLAVIPQVPPGYLGDPLMVVEMIPVAHPDHELHQRTGELDWRDLESARQIVIRDPGSEPEDAGWLEATQRWTVSSLRRSIQMVTRGIGFAWLPRATIRAELERGDLAMLPLNHGGSRPVQLFLVLADAELAGPATRELAQIVREVVAEFEPKVDGEAP